MEIFDPCLSFTFANDLISIWCENIIIIATVIFKGNFVNLNDSECIKTDQYQMKYHTSQSQFVISIGFVPLDSNLQ
jgi:hypothetical protein